MKLLSQLRISLVNPKVMDGMHNKLKQKCHVKLWSVRESSTLHQTDDQLAKVWEISNQRYSYVLATFLRTLHLSDKLITPSFNNSSQACTEEAVGESV